MSNSLPVQTQLLAIFAVMIFLLPEAIDGQVLKADFSSMVAAGKVNGEIYQNPILGITLLAPKTHWEVRGPISNSTRQGRLIDAAYVSGVPERGPEESYTLGLLVESQENFPKVQH